MRALKKCNHFGASKKWHDKLFCCCLLACSFTEIVLGKTECGNGADQAKTDDNDGKRFASQHFSDCVFLHSWVIYSMVSSFPAPLIHVDVHTPIEAELNSIITQHWIYCKIFWRFAWFRYKPESTSRNLEMKILFNSSIIMRNGEIMKKQHFTWNRWKSQ